MQRCVLCQRAIGEREDYMHRGSCGHHLCMPCALPMMRAGKGYCARCPAPQRAADVLGNLVLGNDTEQNRRAAESLRAERRQVSAPLTAAAGVSSLPLSLRWLTRALPQN
jgi:hypothetical protein